MTIKEMDYKHFETICDSCGMPEPELKADKFKMKCTRCNWMDDEQAAVYGYRHCGKFCNCFCHVVAPHFNGESAATHLRKVIASENLQKIIKESMRLGEMKALKDVERIINETFVLEKTEDDPTVSVRFAKKVLLIKLTELKK